MPYDSPFDHPNLAAANAEMQLSPQEIALYQRHLTNLYGSGGVDNPNGSRSTLYQAVVGGPEGKFYSIPTVRNGAIIPPRDAAAMAAKEGWGNFPAYSSPEEADARYEKLHGYMEKDTGDYFRNFRNKLGD